MNEKKRIFCIAPMMGYTTPHARYFYHLITKNAYLFTEMIAAKALIYSKNKKFIEKKSLKNHTALQVGGADYKDLSISSKLAEKNYFDEINLNVGCPSKAVKKGRFGACLMKEKSIVKDCLNSMMDSTSIEVTMKCRIGVDEYNDYDFFRDFIGYIVKDSNLKTIYVHARNALLNGVSPKYNRTVPVLKYEYVYKIKKDFPNIEFIINGGITNLESAKKLSKDLDGVMLGRLILSNPFILKEIDKNFYNKNYSDKFNANVVISKYFNYIRKNIDIDSIYRLCSPLLNIFYGVKNNSKIKTKINEYMRHRDVNKLESFIQNVSQ